jgi:hypothetical protein
MHRRLREGFLVNSCFDGVLYRGKVCAVCVANPVCYRARGLQADTVAGILQSDPAHSDLLARGKKLDY